MSVCFNFPAALFPNGFKPQMPFSLASWYFGLVSTTGGGMPPFISQQGTGRGLQFPDQGIKIKLPAPSLRVSVSVGVFSQPVKVELLSGRGTVIASMTTSVSNGYQTRVFRVRRKVTWVVLTGGNNEGILVEVCA